MAGAFLDLCRDSSWKLQHLNHNSHTRRGRPHLFPLHAVIKISKYDDLTVVKLRDELTKRELPKGGLKAALIQRLRDDDWRLGVAGAASRTDADTDMQLDRPSSEADLESETGSSSVPSSPGESPADMIKRKLRSCLSNVRYAGSFMASKSAEKVVDPGLHINKVGNISLPLRLQDAKAIMKLGTQAPFGRGSATIVDKSFRNTIELSPGQFELRNPAWPQEIVDIVTRLCKVLGFTDSPLGIKAELYKMLLYEKSAMFKPRKE